MVAGRTETTPAQHATPEQWDEWLRLYANRNDVAEQYAVMLTLDPPDWIGWRELNEAILRRKNWRNRAVPSRNHPRSDLRSPERGSAPVSDQGTATTLPGPRRCPWCGHRCHGETCRYCMDMERAARAVWSTSLGDDLPTMRAELRQATKRPATPDFRATCPKCGELAHPRAFTCGECGTALYLPKSDPLYRPPPGTLA